MRTLITDTLVFFALLIPARCAVAVDNTVIGGYHSSGVFAYSHTCTGPSRVLFVHVWGDTSDTTTEVTYAGVPMIALAKLDPTGTHSPYWQYVFYLIAPTQGANNVVVTSTNQTITISESFTGASQASQPGSWSVISDAIASATGTSALTFPAGADGGYLAAYLGDNFGPPLPVSPGTVSAADDAYELTHVLNSSGPVSGGSNGLSFNTVGGGYYNAIIYSIAPDTAPNRARHEVISQ